MKEYSCRKAFTNTILNKAQDDKDIVVITSDAKGSVTLNEFCAKLPDQFIEVGIAEQNAVSTAAGLSLCGKKPFVCGPACFYSSRSYEQLKVDAAYTKTNVKVIGVSGGVSYGALGTTHHSTQDIAAVRALPDMTIILPCDAAQTRVMTDSLVNYDGPVYVRMGRAAVPSVYEDDNIPFSIGKANTLLDGNDITIIATGEMVYYAFEAGKNLRKLDISARVIDMHTIKPLDKDAIIDAARNTKAIITVEEHNVLGGLGGSVAEVISQNYPVRMSILGIPDENAVSGKSTDVFAHYGLDAEGITKTAKKLLNC